MIHDKDTRELYIYDDIGPEWAGMISAGMVRDALRELGDGPVTVRVNSYGGGVDEALSMLELLSRHRGAIDVTVDSIAASAASLFPAMFHSSAASHARVMIHNPWGIAAGNAKELRKTADVLDKYADSLVDVYLGAMSGTEREIRQMLDDETWFSAAEAHEAGLVDTVTEPETRVAAKAVASGRFRNTPQDLLKRSARGGSMQVAAARLRQRKLQLAALRRGAR